MASWDDVVAIGGGLPGVLVRLEAIDEDELATLIEDAWRITAPPGLLTEYEESK